jgi:hypothetical protein
VCHIQNEALLWDRFYKNHRLGFRQWFFLPLNPPSESPQKQPNAHKKRMGLETARVRGQRKMDLGHIDQSRTVMIPENGPWDQYVKPIHKVSSVSFITIERLTSTHNRCQKQEIKYNHLIIKLKSYPYQ